METVTIFARFNSYGSPCHYVFHKLKYVTIIHTDKLSVIALIPKWFYEVNRNWLLSHPALSCFTEINIIKPKQDGVPY